MSGSSEATPFKLQALQAHFQLLNPLLCVSWLSVALKVLFSALLVDSTDDGSITGTLSGLYYRRTEQGQGVFNYLEACLSFSATQN